MVPLHALLFRSRACRELADARTGPVLSPACTPVMPGFQTSSAASVSDSPDRHSSAGRLEPTHGRCQFCSLFNALFLQQSAHGQQVQAACPFQTKAYHWAAGQPQASILQMSCISSSELLDDLAASRPFGRVCLHNRSKRNSLALTSDSARHPSHCCVFIASISHGAAAGKSAIGICDI